MHIVKYQFFKSLFVLSAILPALSGCLSPEQIRANQLRAQQEQQYQYQQAMNAIRSKCDSYGFQRGTPAFAQCVQQEFNRAESCAASKRAIEERVSNCQGQCYTSLNVMQCQNRCAQVYGSIPNC